MNNQIDFGAFTEFCRTLVGKQLELGIGKGKFTLQNLTERAFFYQAADGKVLKQNVRYVQRVLEQYAKIQSLNPGHYANITQNGAYVLALIQLYLNNGKTA